MSLPVLPDAPLIALHNADLCSPDAQGLSHLLLGGGKVLWIGRDRAGSPITAVTAFALST